MCSDEEYVQVKPEVKVKLEAKESNAGNTTRTTMNDDSDYDDF